MKSLEEGLSTKMVAQYFSEMLDMAKGENPDEISPEAFCELMIQKNIGNYGQEFFHDYIETAFKSL